jgi:hypothetical protein
MNPLLKTASPVPRHGHFVWHWLDGPPRAAHPGSIGRRSYSPARITWSPKLMSLVKGGGGRFSSTASAQRKKC